MAAYVYRHIRKDKDVPFYIGIALTKPTTRPFRRAHEKSGHNKAWRSIVDRAGYEVEIMLDDLTPDQALEKEVELIKLYGRVDNGGTLINRTDGGDGTLNPPAETRALMRLKKLGTIPANNGKKMSQEFCDKVKAGLKLRGKIIQPEWTEERRKNQSARNKIAMTGPNNPNYGKPRTEEAKRKIGLANKGRTSSNKGKPMAPKLYQKWNQKSIERRKPVLQYGPDKKFIAEHLSITHAVKAVGVTQSVLLVALKTNGRVKAGGYHWKHKTSSDYPQELVVEKLIRKPNPKLSEKHKEALIRGSVAASRKLVLNVVTGIYYENIGDASIAMCIKRTTLNAMLIGQNKNKTDLIYA